jgi:hypothetical protein
MTDSIIIIASISLGLSLVVVCLRCYVRLKLVRSFGIDDLIIIVAMVSFTPLPRKKVICSNLQVLTS